MEHGKIDLVLARDEKQHQPAVSKLHPMPGMGKVKDKTAATADTRRHVGDSTDG